MSTGGDPRDVASAPTQMLATTRLAPGTLFADRYEILAALGEGGMGAVFKVLDRELREEVALKVLRAELADAPGMLERFRREVKLARRVTHPNVARTFDLGSWRGVRYLTMELIAGEPLSRAYAARRATMPEALRIAGEVARGLAAAHAAGIVHRDLKPDNVLLAADRVVVTDFGIARQAEGAIDPVTRTASVVIGTPAYMAPEQLEGRELDGRTDVYALGIVLYELLTGRAPFAGDNLYALAAARVAGATPDPRSLDASIPEAVAALVTEMLRVDRAARPDAQALCDRLDALRGCGVGANVERAPRLPPLSVDLSRIKDVRREPRSLAFLPLVAADDDARSLAEELSEAAFDAVSGLRVVRAVPAPKVRSAIASGEGEADPVVVGRAVDAHLVLEGSVRVVGAAARVRARLVDVERASTLWADRFDGKVDDPFPLEDALVSALVETIRARESTDASRGGPTDPRVREVYDQARTEYVSFALPRVRNAIAILEQALVAHPGDPWLLSLLGASLSRAWLQTGAMDRDLIARAEEASLRALSLDATIADTFHTIAILRNHAGEGRAAVKALHETLARAPLHAEAHLELGRVLVETGYAQEGIERIELSLRLDPRLQVAWNELAKIRALLGDRAAAEQALARATEVGGAHGALFATLRLVIWWLDRERAAKIADFLEANATGASWERSAPLLRALAKGEVFPPAIEIFDRIASDARAAPRHRAFMHELAAEYFGAMGMNDAALDAVERAAELPLIDLFWMDRCPTLTAIREHPRFAKARATVAARAAEVWG